MRRLADDFLGRRQPDRRAHRPRQPRPGIGRRRPYALGKSTQHHHVRGLQPRLQQAPDEHARMLGPAAPTQRPTAAHDLALQHRIQQSRQHVVPLVRQQGQRGLHVGQPDRQRLAFLPGPQARGPGQFVGGGKALARLDQCRQGLGRRDLDRGIDPQRRLQAGFQPRQQRFASGSARARSSARRSPARPRRGRGPRRQASSIARAPRGRRPAPVPPLRADASAAREARPAPVLPPRRGPAVGGTPPVASPREPRRRCRPRPRRSAADRWRHDPPGRDPA